MDLKELGSGVDPASHWYYRTKKLPALAYLRAVLARRAGPLDVVDVGAGSGFFSECLIETGGRRLRDVIRVDSNYAAEESRSDARIAGSLSRTRELPARVRGALILMMDVLEHVADDRAFLRATVERCEGENYFFLTAPAFMSLWSPHDEFLGHVRRYTLAELTALAQGCGLTVTSRYYLFGAIFPAVWLTRRLKRGAAASGDLRPASWPVSFLLELIGRVEFVFRRLNRLAGVTCVVEARLPGGAR